MRRYFKGFIFQDITLLYKIFLIFQGFHSLINHVRIKYEGIGNDLAKDIRKPSVMEERTVKAI